MLKQIVPRVRSHGGICQPEVDDVPPIRLGVAGAEGGPKLGPMGLERGLGHLQGGPAAVV